MLNLAIDLSFMPVSKWSLTGQQQSLGRHV
jgi:hypothetical protein